MAVTQFQDAGISILTQLHKVVGQMSDTDFVKPSAALGGVTIGQHLRHTIEFFLCLEAGYSSGKVNYDERDHDTLIEKDKALALAALERICAFLASTNQDKPLQLGVCYERDSENFVVIETNYSREVVYNIEHAVHHMAIMKIGIREVAPYVDVPHEFGIAASTLRYAQSLMRPR